MTIPDDFPRFSVPGFEKEMVLLRTMFWLHYPKSGPGATLWDEWMSAPALWPPLTSQNYHDKFLKQWKNTLSSRFIDPEGYVATHQHPSITHQHGWPFPFWNFGKGSAGWHFSFKNTVGPPFRFDKLATTEDWILQGAESLGINEEGWKIKLNSENASLSLKTLEKKIAIDVYQAPFIQIRWIAPGSINAEPYIEWISDTSASYNYNRRIYFDPPSQNKMVYTMIPMYKHPEWKGNITQLKIGFGNTKKNIPITIQAIFTHYDTRHNVNAQSFIRGCANYFWWTGDYSFLRKNINRMRKAFHYMMTEHRTRELNIVFTGWVGHEGRTGLQKISEKENRILHGNGIGNNYWDLLPFGYKDAYATLRYYDTVKVMEKLESEILAHPGWNIPGGIFKLDPAYLEKHAENVKQTGNDMFWNKETERFVAAIDIDGKKWDYGFTFVNLEAIHYNFATREHAEKILGWISGERTVSGDTSTGKDIYHWRFAPRSTTKRNTEYYAFVWSAPQNIPWGGQVQDGGAVLGWSYHDLMARLKIKGADNCWNRLKQILEWFDQVQTAGGYRKYYKDRKDATLQGGGTAGGLGLDFEFVESILVPQIVIDGFIGFQPCGDGFAINPSLPGDWRSCMIDRIYFHGMIFSVKASKDTIEISCTGEIRDPCNIYPPEASWNVKKISPTGEETESRQISINRSNSSIMVDWREVSKIILEKNP